jgi:hypothetical protein
VYLVEGCSAQMHVLHEHQQVEPWVSEGLHEARSCALAFGQADGVSLDAIVSELALLGC